MKYRTNARPSLVAQQDPSLGVNIPTISSPLAQQPWAAAPLPNAGWKVESHCLNIAAFSHCHCYCRLETLARRSHNRHPHYNSSHHRWRTPSPGMVGRLARVFSIEILQHLDGAPSSLSWGDCVCVCFFVCTLGRSLSLFRSLFCRQSTKRWPTYGRRKKTTTLQAADAAETGFNGSDA